jgi:hypothetical protein
VSGRGRRSVVVGRNVTRASIKVSRHLAGWCVSLPSAARDGAAAGSSGTVGGPVRVCSEWRWASFCRSARALRELELMRL